ncbi:filamentous hemagglutinin family protein [Paraburkholderia sp. RAU2J]|uniref:two-partner secretion domain-containing protein n=1 Tax=Paraburkholderia sp. RAU2J TaxID=1938810 RepID=UPI000EB033C9|nr:filamentous hemagglutinin N-terminal domain-containing protein [Paraburkholderia sp. RAU2J]RKT21106.1 filamentous hemagglutinin family protein [Paraburkholderia sp. RAU2J]
MRPPFAIRPMRRIALLISIPLAGLPFAQSALAAGVLPQGGHFVAGAGTLTGNGTALLVTQPGSTRGVIDWNSFSIGKRNTVMFDNGSGATLNRVTAGSPSAILGSLNATGSVYLINPQGIVVGPSGVVSTGGRFVATTLDLCNDAFVNGGNALTLSGKSNASVINLGRISSSGGDVFLIARRTVVNAGSVKAPKGTVEMAAGEQVLLQDSANSMQVFVETGSQGDVVNQGRIKAAQISLQAADGNVYALAGRGTRIRASGTATRDGHVWLVADSGLVRQSGKIAATNADGSGGTVDTDAAKLAFGNQVAIEAGKWNLFTPAFTIDAAAARSLQRSLNAGTSVDVTTTGANGASGDVNVGADMRWHGPASLMLAAYRNVSIATGATIANQGAGNLSLRADASGIDNGGGIANHGVIDWSASTGAVGAFYDLNGAYTAGTQMTNAAWTPPAYSGLITQITAYSLVNSMTDLKNVASDLAGNYALGRNIDASSTSDGSYVPIGNAGTPFSGQFDGQGKAISSLTLEPWLPSDPNNPQLMGLFGVIGSGAVVRNLSVNGSGTLGANVYGYVGILAGMNDGTVVRVDTSGKLASSDSSSIDFTITGGLVGGNSGTVLRSSSSVTATTGGTLGGLAGANSGAIIQSYATGAMLSSGYINAGAGGLVGYNSGSISQSYATGPTTLFGYCRGAVGTPCGGAALVVTNLGTISQSFATGAVTQPFYEPIGIARSNSGSIANDVYWNKDTTNAAVGVVYGTGVPAANGLTSAQMATPSSFVSYDFSSTGVWAMPVGATHPVLRWQLAQ